MTRIADILKAEIESLTENTSYHLIELKYFISKKNVQISVFMDKEDGFFSHQDCAHWTNKIQDIIDGKALINDNYRLELSSPGIARPLTETWEFRKNLEQKLEIDYTDEEGVIRSCSGVLVDVSDQKISLKNKNEVREFSRELVNKAVVKIPW